MAALLFETLSGLAVTLGPFHSAVQWSLLLHTAIGAVTLLPLAWYCTAHWLEYRRYVMSHIVLLGWVALVGLAVCSLSGMVITIVPAVIAFAFLQRYVIKGITAGAIKA